MPSLLDYLSGKNLKQTLPDSAHWAEQQWVHPSVDWAQGTEMLRAMAPRDTRVERPKRWYELLRLTHWPGQVPPGNGPFFVPDWALEVMGETETERLRAGLRAGGFRDLSVPVAVVPPSSDYLVWAMRITQGFRWTANPVLYQVYWYPTLGAGRVPELRPFTVRPWDSRG